MENHTHDELGNMVVIEPSPVEADLAATEAVTDSAVEIARIEAEKEITLAKIAAKQIEPDLEMQLAAALAELEALRAIVSPPAPEPMEEAAPVVVVTEDSSEGDTEPSEEDSLPVPEPVEEEHKPRKGSAGFFNQY